MKLIGKLLPATLLFLGLSTSLAAAAEIVPVAELAGTIWAAQQQHDRTTIDNAGHVAVKQGKDIYVEFGDLVGGVYTITIHWWNVSAGINVVEYAVLVPAAENTFTYVESNHAAGSDFPGIQGGGEFRIVDENSADLTQMGHLLDGSASAFVTHLTRVDEAPAIPIPQTYPAS